MIPAKCSTSTAASVGTPQARNACMLRRSGTSLAASSTITSPKNQIFCPLKYTHRATKYSAPAHKSSRQVYRVPSRILPHSSVYITVSRTGESCACKNGQFSRAMLLQNTTVNSYSINASKKARCPQRTRASPPQSPNR